MTLDRLQLRRGSRRCSSPINVLLNGFFLFLGKWAFDIVMNVVERRMQGAELLMQILVWSPLSACVTAVAGVVALMAAPPRAGDAGRMSFHPNDVQRRGSAASVHGRRRDRRVSERGVLPHAGRSSTRSTRCSRRRTACARSRCPAPRGMIYDRNGKLDRRERARLLGLDARADGRTRCARRCSG